MLYTLGSLALGLTLPRVEVEHVGVMTQGLAAPSAIAFFSAVGSGMLALTGIGLAVAFLIVQFSASAYTIRMFTTALARPELFHTLGVFFATFTYALAALLWTDRNGSSAAPLISTYLVGVLLIFSMLRFTLLIWSLRDLQIQRVLQTIGDCGRAAIGAAFPEPAPADDGPAAALAPAVQVLVHTGPPRSIVALDLDALAALAREASAVIVLAHGVGDTMVEPGVLLCVHGGRAPEAALRRAVRLAPARSLDEDPKFAVRILVDIAIRALSPAINDPTTAVQALDQIEDLMLRLGRAPIEARTARDDAGEVRVIFPASSWDDWLALAFDEIRHYGAGSVQVGRRLRAALADLIAQLPAGPRREAAQAYLDHLDRSVAQSGFDEEDRVIARGRDWQGLGLSH